MRVSSKHMILASSVFEAMLQPGRFKEEIDLDSNGKAEIPLPDDDSEPFVILLDIIHGRPRKVPRVVNLHLLSGLAVLIDKY